MKRLMVILFCMLLLAGCGNRAEYLLAEEIWDDGDGSPQRTVYEYNEVGQLQVQTTEDADFYGMGPFYERTEFEYDANGQLLRQRVYDETGCIHEREYVNAYNRLCWLVKAESYMDGVLSETWEHTYHGTGRVSQTKFFRHSPYSTDTGVKTFDESGNLLREETSTVLNGVAACGFVEYTYRNGKLAEHVTDSGVRTVYEYDRQGRTKQITVYRDDAVDSSRIFTYDRNTEKETHCGADGEVLFTQVRTYDKAGNLLKEENFRFDGTPGEVVNYSYITK